MGVIVKPDVKFLQNQILLGDCLTELKKIPTASVDLVFADPPYNKGLGEQALRSLVEGGWLAANAVVVLEESERAVLGDVEGLTRIDQRTYGDTVVTFFRAAGPLQEGPAGASSGE